jgi:hypothetical protein
MSATAVSADTLVLLITAALRYGILASRTRVAFSPTADVLQAPPPTPAGCCCSSTSPPRLGVSTSPPPRPSELRCYQHVPVPHVDPVHVLKALHLRRRRRHRPRLGHQHRPHSDHRPAPRRQPGASRLHRCPQQLAPALRAQRHPDRARPPVASHRRRGGLDDAPRARRALGRRGRRAAHRRHTAGPARRPACPPPCLPAPGSTSSPAARSAPPTGKPSPNPQRC